MPDNMPATLNFEGELSGDVLGVLDNEGLGVACKLCDVSMLWSFSAKTSEAVLGASDGDFGGVEGGDADAFGVGLGDFVVDCGVGNGDGEGDGEGKTV